jgi:polyhydroxybutyrate depolymerase
MKLRTFKPMTGIIFLLLVVIVVFLSACYANQIQQSQATLKEPILSQRTRKRGRVNLNQDMLLRRLSHQGLERSYYLYTSSSYTQDRPMPLLLAFHGGVGQGNNMAAKTGFNNLADRENFLVVYPNGIDLEGPGGQWNDGRNTPEVHPEIDDVSFVRAVIEDVAKLRNIDRKRIYVTGGSNGGIFAQRLACEMSDQIAAVASVSATMAKSLRPKCQPQRAIPILMINGTDDKLVPWRGGEMKVGARGEILSVPDTVAFWRQNNGCSATPKQKEVADTEPDGTKVVSYEYSGCQENATVILYQIEGGGHGWPGGQPRRPINQDNFRNRSYENLVGKTSQEINASEVVWEFLQQYTLP